MPKPKKTLSKPEIDASKIKMWTIRVAIVIVTSIVMAVTVRFATLSEDDVANAVLRGEPLLQIIILSLINAAILSTLLTYTLYVKRDSDVGVRSKTVPVIAVSVLLTFILSMIFGSLVSLYIVPLSLCSLLVATLVDRRVGIVTNILISQTFFLAYILVYGTEDAVESSAALVTSMVASIFLIMFLDKAFSRLKFTVVGVIVGVCTAVIPMLINYLVGANETTTILVS